MFKKWDKWAKSHVLGIFLFNLTLLLMVLLNTAQYFKPFFYLSINVIFFLALIFSVLVLRAGFNVMFYISAVFLVFAAFLKTVNVEVWADRAIIYFFQAFLVGFFLLLISRKES